MENTTVSKVTISKDNAVKLIGSIQENLKVVNKGYLTIAPDLQKLYDTKAFEVLGYKNFDELCDSVFDMSHGTSVGIRKVFGLYGTKTRDGQYIIPEKYLVFGYTKLLWFANDKKKFEQANINPIEVFTPDMTLADMKLTLAGTLADKAKEQDANAIETTATDVDDNATTDDNATSDNNANDNAEFEPMTKADWEANPKGYVDAILKDLSTLKDILEPTLKAEKMALVDGAIAYLKDVKKAIKK